MKETLPWLGNDTEPVKVCDHDLPLPHNHVMEFLGCKAICINIRGTIPTNPHDTLCQFDTNYLPNIFYLLKIVCTLPVTSCSCELSTSSLKLLRIYARYRVGQKWLNGLALHCRTETDHDLDRFSRKPILNLIS